MCQTASLHSIVLIVQVVPPPKPPPQGATPSADDVAQSLKSGIAFHSSLQQPDGHFPGDYGGPMFLMPGLIIACYVSKCIDTVLTPAHRTEMIRYLHNHQNPDGGYGLHIEGPSTMFGTGLKCASKLRPDRSSTAHCLCAQAMTQDCGPLERT